MALKETTVDFVHGGGFFLGDCRISMVVTSKNRRRKLRVKHPPKVRVRPLKKRKKS